MLLRLLEQSPIAFVVVAGILLYSLALHELGHAWVAERVGDKTARNLGRITLNPLKHLDPMGTILIFIAGFGWAKPVPVNPQNFRDYRSGVLLVSLAGVTVNILIALALLALLAYLGIRMTDAGQITTVPGSQAMNLLGNRTGATLLEGLFLGARINIVLAVFNLFPIPPLDGSRVLQAFAPQSWQRTMWQLGRYGIFILILALVFFDRQIFGVIDAVMRFFMRLLLA